MTERGKPYEGVGPAGVSTSGDSPAGAPANRGSPGERRIALVIGNGSYSHAGVLTNPINDAREMSAVLRRFGFDVIDGIDVARDPMEDLLYSFEKKVAKADVSLLFYAGHGLQVRGCNYLLPVDANIQGEAHLKRRAFSLNEILDIMGRNQRTSIVFLDACRNNPFTRQLRDLGIRDVGAKGLAKVDRVPGSLIAFATEADNVAQDGKGDNSPFTKALLKHIPTSGLSLTDMMIDVRNDVIAETDREQQPWVQYSLEKRFYFIPGGVPPAPSESTSPRFPSATFTHGTLEWSETQWESLKDSADIARLKRFAEHAHPYYAGEARDLIAALEAKAAREKAEAEQRAQEDSNWAWAQQENTADAYKRFINAWPGGRFSAEAEQRINALADAERQREAEEKERQAKAVTERYRSEGRVHIPAPVIHGASKDDTGGWFKPGNGKKEWFKDIDVGPEMVVVPAGKFIMGSPEDEPERVSTESPQHEVRISNPFAVSRCAITFGEWDAYVSETGGTAYKPEDEGWGRARHPVINVNWDDAGAYAAWLSDKSGKPYRLLTEAEWEYAARADTTGPFWWGKSITTEQANYNGNYTYKGGGDKGQYRKKTVPVDDFEANPWGLYNVHGNVWEWCEDLWHDSYKGAPNDGTAWLDGGKKGRRVVRGGSWYGSPGFLRSAYRGWNASDYRVNNFGFRLARTLNP